MSAPKLLQVVDKELRTDKQGREYALITFEKSTDKKVRLPNGKVIVAKGQTTQGKIVAYDEPYLQNVDHDPNFDLKTGEYVLGDIVKRKVQPYTIESNDGESRVVDTYQCVVLGDTTEEETFELEVERTFRSRDRILLTSEMEDEGVVVEDIVTDEEEVSDELAI